MTLSSSMAGKFAIAFIVIAIVTIIFAAPLIPTTIYSTFFNWGEVRFVDNNEIPVTVKVGTTKTVYVNVESTVNKPFSDLRLSVDLGDYDLQFLKVTPHDFKVDGLFSKDARTGDTAIDIQALKLVPGMDEAIYKGKIQVFSGEKLLNVKSIKIIIVQ